MRDMTDQSHHFQSIRDGIGRAVASHLRFKFKDGRAATAGVTCCCCFCYYYHKFNCHLLLLWRKATSRPLQPISPHHRKSLHYLLRLPRKCKECEEEQWSCPTKDGLLLNWGFHPRSGIWEFNFYLFVNLLYTEIKPELKFLPFVIFSQNGPFSGPNENLQCEREVSGGPLLFLLKSYSQNRSVRPSVCPQRSSQT